MPDIVTVAGIVEPLRAYNYQVTIIRAPSGFPTIQGLEWRAIRVTIPDQAFNSIEIWYRWFRWFVPGTEAMAKTIDITWWEDVDLSIYGSLWAWREAVGSWETGEQWTKDEISGDIEIALLDGSEGVVGTVTVMNAFLLNIGTIDLAYGDSRVVEVTATFQFDWLERGV